MRKKRTNESIEDGDRLQQKLFVSFRGTKGSGGLRRSLILVALFIRFFFTLKVDRRQSNCITAKNDNQ